MAQPDPLPPRDARPPQESDEDLFDFDEPFHGAAAGVDGPRALDDTLKRVGHAAKDVAATIETRPSTARPVVPAKTVVPVAAPTQGIVHHRLKPTPLLSGLIAALVLFHLVAMFVSWRSLRAVETVILDLGKEVVDSTTSLREKIEGEAAAAADAPSLFGALPEGYRTLELAQERIARGEFARARRTLNGLLAVIDRVEDPARKDVEARASVLIAESYSAEARVQQARVSPSSDESPRRRDGAAEEGR